MMTKRHEQSTTTHYITIKHYFLAFPTLDVRTGYAVASSLACARLPNLGQCAADHHNKACFFVAFVDLAAVRWQKNLYSGH